MDTVGPSRAESGNLQEQQMVVMSEHPELALEQAYVDRAYQFLDRGLAEAERNMAEHKTLHRHTAQALQRALRILRDSRGTGQLVFGKMQSDGETLYIGRRRVHDENRDPVVVGWHAPAAAVFYEASPQDPRGLDLKRVFTEDERVLVRVIDEIVAQTAAAAADPTGAGAAFSDALLAELERSRDGAMRDVVATIQAEQFAIIRAPIAPGVVVQGGPGTGKTVVGLHRAAWLAFNHDELRRTGILVVAPSTSFLTYVSGVLPSLNVTDVDQIEVHRLYAGEAEIRAEGDLVAERVKGSAAMSTVLRRALDARIGWGEDDLVLQLGADHIRLSAVEVSEMVESVRQKKLSHADGRDEVRERLARMAVERHRTDQQAAGRPARATEGVIRRLASFANALDRAWPTFTPESFLRSLYGTQTLLVNATEGVLTVDERASLFRPSAASVAEEPWTEADLYCLDELSHLLTGEVVTYGHVVVDEAQDLSPMQARCVARRCPSGSFTVLGDLAQATGTWIRDGWDELTAHLGCPDAAVHELSIGYRVPAEVLDLAARQLPLAGVGLEPPRSIRRGYGHPALVACEPESRSEVVEKHLLAALARNQRCAVIVADQSQPGWLADLRARGLPVGDGAASDFAEPVTVLPVQGVKGLEFDHVVLVEPGEIASQSQHPARTLYVAMTRSTQSLDVVHCHSLPPGFPVAVEPLADDREETPGGIETSSDVSDGGSSAQVLGAPSSPAETSRRLAELADRLQTLDQGDLELVERLVARLSPREPSEDQA